MRKKRLADSRCPTCRALALLTPKERRRVKHDCLDPKPSGRQHRGRGISVSR